MNKNQKYRPKVLWLCRTDKEKDILEDAILKSSISELKVVQPRAPHINRDEVAFLFETKNNVDYIFHNLGGPVNIKELVKEVDIAYFPFFFQKLHIAEVKGFQAKAFSDELTSQGKPIFMQICDVKFNTTANFLVKNTDQSPGARKTKEICFINPDQRLIFQVSYKKGVGDRLLFNRLFAPRSWRKSRGRVSGQVELTREIEYIESEWITLNWPIIKEEARLWKARQRLLFEEQIAPINRFYYGIDRPGIVESLRELGLGESPDDALAGKIARLFPKVRSLSPPETFRLKEPFEWRLALPETKKLLFPFEKYKSEGMVTPRMMEALLYVGENTELVVDPRVAPFMKEILADRSGALMEEEYQQAAKSIEEFWTKILDGERFVIG